jgi:hypothetical protein
VSLSRGCRRGASGGAWRGGLDGDLPGDARCRGADRGLRAPWRRCTIRRIWWGSEAVAALGAQICRSMPPSTPPFTPPTPMWRRPMPCLRLSADRGLRRYGFHGLELCGAGPCPVRARSFASTAAWPVILGNGASLCAIQERAFGRDDDGLFAAGRADHGHADRRDPANAVLRLAERHGVTGRAHPEPGKRASGSGRVERPAQPARGGDARGGLCAAAFRLLGRPSCRVDGGGDGGAWTPWSLPAASARTIPDAEGNPVRGLFGSFFRPPLQ